MGWWQRAAMKPVTPAFAAALLLQAAVASTQAQTYPQRSVQIIVPYTTGTGADMIARTLGPRLAERWKVGVITDNRPGATGNIGTEFVAKSAPDGHVLLMTATSFSTVPALSGKLPFDPAASFVPVIQTAAGEMTFAVHPQLPAKTMQNFVTLARQRPGQLLYSSPGNGGPQHLAVELIKLETGINIVHVPYKGSSGAIIDLIGGHVQAMVVAMQTIAPQARAGKVRLLAVMGEKRSAAFPEVPTLIEEKLPNLVVESWYGLFAPAATPQATVARLNSEINTLLQQPDVRESLARQGINAVGGTPERFGALVKSELARWARVVAVAKIKSD